MPPRTAPTLDNISVEDLRPIEDFNTARMGHSSIGNGQTIEAPLFDQTTWYHPDGTTSELPTHLDALYGAKKGFFIDPPDGWHDKANAYVNCPMSVCNARIRLVDETDDEALRLIGIEPTPAEDRKKNAVLGHLKRAHKSMFADMVRRGVVSEGMVNYL